MSGIKLLKQGIEDEATQRAVKKLERAVNEALELIKGLGVTASNVGGGEGVFRGKTGNNLEFKSLTAGAGVTLTSSANEINVSATSEDTTGSNVGAGAKVFKDKSGTALRFRSIVGGGSVVVTENADEIKVEASSGGGGIGGGYFGTGQDGDAVFDGVSSVLGMTPTPGHTIGTQGGFARYVMVQDLYLDNCEIPANVAVLTAGFRLFVKTTLTLDGVVGFWGNNGGDGTAANGAPATAGVASVGLAPSVGGGTGGNTSTGVAGNGANQANQVPFSFGTTFGFGGAGGAAASGAGGTRGNRLAAGVHTGDLANIYQGVAGRQVSGALYGAGSGGGGGRGSPPGHGVVGGGGAGGASGGGTVVVARQVVGVGKVSARGGDGGRGFGDAAGGGGGGGGWAVVSIGSGPPPTIDVIGGTGGPGSGSGTAGEDGQPGRSYLFNMGA